jgi:hypothetical protein
MFSNKKNFDKGNVGMIIKLEKCHSVCNLFLKILVLIGTMSKQEQIKIRTTPI